MRADIHTYAKRTSAFLCSVNQVESIPHYGDRLYLKAMLSLLLFHLSLVVSTQQMTMRVKDSFVATPSDSFKSRSYLLSLLMKTTVTLDISLLMLAYVGFFQESK